MMSKPPRERRTPSGSKPKSPARPNGNGLALALPRDAGAGPPDPQSGVLSETEARTLLDMYYAIPDRKTRERLTSYIRMLSL